MSACPLIGIIAIQPEPIVTTVAGHEMPEGLSEWAAHGPVLSARAMLHMRTRPNPTSGGLRLLRKQDELVYMYGVSHSMDVESQ